MSVGVFCVSSQWLFQTLFQVYISKFRSTFYGYIKYSTHRAWHLLGLCKNFSLGTRQWIWGSESCAFLNILLITQCSLQICWHKQQFTIALQLHGHFLRNQYFGQKMIWWDNEIHQVWRHYFRAKVVIFQKMTIQLQCYNCPFWDLLCFL